MVLLYNVSMPNTRQLKDLGDMIREARQQRGWTLKTLSEQSGVGYSYISNIERGYVNPKRGPVTPSDDILFAISQTLDISLTTVHAMLGRMDTRQGEPTQPNPAHVLDAIKKLINAPEDVLNRIGPTVNLDAIYGAPLSPLRASAGDLVPSPSQAEEMETVGDRMPHQTRGIQVVGDCMEPFYQNGDIVIVRETPTAENGQKVIALVDGEYLSCKVYRANGTKYLEPLNGEGKITADRFRIIGVIIKLIRDA